MHLLSIALQQHSHFFERWRDVLISALNDRNMALVFAALSVSSEQNRIAAALARKQGEDAMADLLAAIAASERIQARRVLYHLRGRLKDLVLHVARLKQSKGMASEDEFPYLEDCYSFDTEGHASQTMARGAEIAKMHRALLEAAATEKISHAYRVCQVCGFVAVDQAPKRCPICKASRERFAVP